MTIAHAISCFFLTGFIYLLMQGNVLYAFDRRQYAASLILSFLVTSAYFLSLFYVVLKSTTSFDFLSIMEALLDLLGSLANTPLAFMFALLMNMILFIGIYVLNYCSFYMVELSKMVEWKRTGGRNRQELEMNSF